MCPWRLPLYDNSAKVGLGLWRHLAISLPLEFGLLAGGAWLYARAVPAKVMRGQSRFGSSWRYFSCFSSGTISGRRQARVTELALMALASFLFLPVGAALVEWTASSRAAGQQKAAAVLPAAAFRKRMKHRWQANDRVRGDISMTRSAHFSMRYRASRYMSASNRPW
jgi:hypothetical protein